ncbi:SDR family NAD(P)-dependent oxidoreductase [Pseudaquabacterium pictum]|uniref:SDR family NAD(P)-dependent oxidoreductase n=1 Tax=Pseudaquabacterium pictum TaxID=2315236 RepID=UPI0010F49AC5|nr:SDR family NAD(P)-dependent oxidoreductase [Rubrivivax pictus]
MTAASMASLPDGYRALVVGARGGIGAAFVQALQADPRCATVVGLHRGTDPALDLADEASVAAAAAALAPAGRFHLLVNAAGLLHGPGFQPEKKLGDLNTAQLLATFTANAIGPALLLRHFSPLLDRQRALLAMLSAKVGSIGDNRLGGWYSYRASKAALNMLLATAAIELRRSQPQTVVVALHPGTVSTGLSAPFRGGEIGRPPDVAVAQMLATLDGLAPTDSGSFVAYDGQRLPW